MDTRILRWRRLRAARAAKGRQRGRAVARRSERSDPLDERAGAQPAAATHRDERQRPVGAFELVHGFRHEERTGASERVAQRDCAAVGVGALEIGAELALPREHHRCERLVDLDQVDVGHRHAGPRQEALRRDDGSREHEDGVDADEAGVDDPRPGPQPECPGLLGGRHQQGGCAVADLRRRAGGVHAVGAAHGLQPGEGLEGGVAQALVARDGVGGARGLAGVVDVGGVDGQDLRVEPALGPCLRRPLLRGEAELVGVGPGDAPLVGDALGALELRREFVVPEVRLGDRHPQTERLGRVGPDGHPRHQLDATGHRHVDHPGGYEAAGHVGGLLRRAALSVDGGGGRGQRQPGREPPGAADVERLRADLADAPGHDLIDLLGIDAGAADHLAQHGGQEIRGVHRGQPTVATSDRRADCVDDDDLGHGANLVERMTARPGRTDAASGVAPGTGHHHFRSRLSAWSTSRSTTAPRNATATDPRSKSSMTSVSSPVASPNSVPPIRAPRTPTMIVPRHPLGRAPVTRRAKAPAMNPTTTQPRMLMAGGGYRPTPTAPGQVAPRHRPGHAAERRRLAGVRPRGSAGGGSARPCRPAWSAARALATPVRPSWRVWASSCQAWPARLLVEPVMSVSCFVMSPVSGAGVTFWAPPGASNQTWAPGATSGQGRSFSTTRVRSSSRASAWWRPITCMPTGRPSTVPAGMETAGLPTMLAGMVSTPLFSGPTERFPTRVLRPISAGNATSGLVAQITKSTSSKRSAMRSLASVRWASTRPAISRLKTRSARSSPKAISSVRSSLHAGQRSPSALRSCDRLAIAHSNPRRGSRTGTSTNRRPASRASASPASRTRASTWGRTTALPRLGAITALSPRS